MQVDATVSPREGSVSPNHQQGEHETLTVTTFGGLSISVGRQEVAFASRKSKALIAYLALVPNCMATREHIVGLLWSESDEEKARASLRQVVRTLKPLLLNAGYHGLIVDRNTIGLDARSIRVDATQVLRALEAGELLPSLLNTRTITDTLLAGFDDLDPSFRNWLVVQRENLTQRLGRGLEYLLDEKPDAGSGGARRAAAQALLQLDQTHERACRCLIQMHAEQGEIGAAIALYNRLWELLDQEYDSEPTELTQKLIGDVKLGKFETPAVDPFALPAQLSEGPQSIYDSPPSRQFVLCIGHFDLDGIQEDQRHVCVGFRFELISMLVRFRVWSIVDVTSSASLGLGEPDSPNRYLVNGHLYQNEGALFLTIELQDPVSCELIWSERYVLNLDQFFASQQDIVRKIAHSLNIHISQARLRQVSGQSDVSLDIYDRWLRGHAFVLSWAPALRKRATEIFHSIVRDAPDFAPAYSSLVGILNSNHFVFPGVLRTAHVQEEALKLARKAVELDPLDSRSQLHLAWSQAMNGEYDVAILGFKLACQLNENDPWTTSSAAGGLAYCGEPAEGLKLSERGLELAIAPTPMVWAYTACVRFINGDFAGCSDACSQAEDEVLVMSAWKAAALQQSGLHDPAQAAARRFFEKASALWCGETPATMENAAYWVAQCFPIRDETVLERFRKNLLAAADP